MKKDLILFDDEIPKLKEIGWNYKILFEDKDNRVYLVRAEIPEEIVGKMKELGGD